MPKYEYKCSNPECSNHMTRYGIPVKERHNAPHCDCGWDFVLVIQPVDTTYNKKGSLSK